MKRCNSCHINFNTNEEFCPLCQSPLVGKCDSLFPNNIRYKTSTLILKILLFLSIVIFLSSIFIELILTDEIHISLFLSLGLITTYVVVHFILKYVQNIYIMLNRYAMLLVVLLGIWYFATRSTIITNYIIPSVCICELGFNLIVCCILRKNYFIKYLSQILINIFLFIVPLGFVLFKLTTNNIMSYICCLFSLIVLTGLWIFFNDEIKDEILKMIHT